MFLEISQNSQENTSARVSFLIKLQCRPKACNFIEKETLAQVFSCEFCKICKNNFFHRTPLVAASDCSYSDIRMHLDNVLELCSKYGLLLQSGQVSVRKVLVFLSYFRLKTILILVP